MNSKRRIKNSSKNECWRFIQLMLLDPSNLKLQRKLSRSNKSRNWSLLLEARIYPQNPCSRIKEAQLKSQLLKKFKRHVQSQSSLMLENKVSRNFFIELTSQNQKGSFIKRTQNLRNILKTELKLILTILYNEKSRSENSDWRINKTFQSNWWDNKTISETILTWKTVTCPTF